MSARTKLIGSLVIAGLGGLAGMGQEWAVWILVLVPLGVFALSVIFLIPFPLRL